MCGICGIVTPGRRAETETAAAMARELDHRGPDGRGEYAGAGVALGFRRLAIIDLSAAGNQPLASDDGRLQLVHNGEIYNYRELRLELEAAGHRFRTSTDTEVVLRAYERWGEGCVERFNGMWAFAIWDERERSLFASRDRFGIKPFYYRAGQGRLAFASELKAFRAPGAGPLEANLAAVRDYLQQGYVDHTEGTFFAGIQRLLPAHNFRFDERGLRSWRYWQLEPGEPPDGDPGELVRDLFLDSLRLHLRSDVPVGTCLSGGLDSSAVVCGVDHLLSSEHDSTQAVGDEQRTFTVFFDEPGLDERPFAEAVAERTRTASHWVTVDGSDLVDNVPAIVETQDEPFGSTSMVAQWYVMREARRAGLKVMLDGQGGDEVFAGYRTYFASYFADLLAGRQLAALRREVGAYRSLHGAGAVELAEMLARPFLPARVRWAARGRARGGGALLHADLRGRPPTPESNGPGFDDRLRRALHLTLTERGLPELLRYEDRNSMAHSLEARVPFLDVRLVELLFSLRGPDLIDRGRTKAVLRTALGDLLPPVVRDRVDKLGFVTPERRWLRGRLGELMADVFASRAFNDRAWVDAAAARRRLERHRRGELEAGFELWRAFNLELWAQTYLDRAGG